MSTRRTAGGGAAVAAAALAALLVTGAATADAVAPSRWRVADVSVPATSLLHDVAAVSGSHAWAVGLRHDGSQSPLALHWDGVRWHDVPTASADGAAGLVAVDATATDDVWAVGGSLLMGRPASRVVTHVQHWDGQAWSLVPSADVGRYGGNGSLLDVSARTRRDAWAVGYSLGPNGGESASALIERWDGKRWTIVPAAPAIADALVELHGVDAVSSSDAWAVGWLLTQTDMHPVAQRWDGLRWKAVPLPDLPGSRLNDVLAKAPDDVWAVGERDGQPLVLRFDGSRWADVSPRLSSAVNRLNGVGVDSDGTVHMVGQAVGRDNEWHSLLLARGRDGRWTSQNPPHLGVSDMLNAIAFAGGAGFAVGEHLTGVEGLPEQPLALQR
jgi:hypothetical protein